MSDKDKISRLDCAAHEVDHKCSMTGKPMCIIGTHCPSQHKWITA